MFKEMRRKDREIKIEEIQEILESGEYGVLASTSENGYPYAVPLNYAYHNNKIYIHSAGQGQKLENLEKDPKVSFCIVEQTEILPAEFSTNYRSVIAFGEAKFIDDEELKKEALVRLIKKYSSEYIKPGMEYINKAIGVTTVVEISITHITGKARKSR